jgi:hypothetical protein
MCPPLPSPKFSGLGLNRGIEFVTVFLVVAAGAFLVVGGSVGQMGQVGQVEQYVVVPPDGGRAF